ncbi:MAG: 3-hydroxyacyl-CoA dehydrogenase/enoyl-CoA hydratase family protein [Bryobacterales bacterium]|nr:3-hydroxyacyl-CoA dehydrogenase/enoyl-CoA hydratase family protein [Bryobacterales bacterium]
MRLIQRVAVLGAGTMGARIAAHFANAGIPALLLDVVLPNEKDRNAAARKGLESALKQKPGGFFADAGAARVETGNFDDHLAKIGGCDWVIEAVTERLDVKRALWQRVDAVRKTDAILSTNTSGIPLASIVEGFPAEFRRQFLGTHFFNPPRYLHLLELIPTPDTDPAIASFVAGFCDVRRGKGVVPCKDTPNFIGNRIGSFFGGTVAKLTAEGGYTVEEVDALTGPLIGLPGTASFRLLALVGIDIWASVGTNLYDLVPEDPWRERFMPAPAITELIARGWLGEKSGQGFYRRVGKGADRKIEALDLATYEYKPSKRVTFPSVEQVKTIEPLPDRLRALVAADDRAGRFLWSLFSDTFLYAAERIPEIADRCVEIDRAMRWGYAHTYGPFELWDALGFQDVCRRIEREGRELPASVQWMLRAGNTSFYRQADRPGDPRTEYFDLGRQIYGEIEPRAGITVLADRKRAGGVVRRNPGASLVDLGDGVLGLEFHTKMNTLGEDIFRMIYAGIDETARNWQAMVVANQGSDFSAGANLMMVLLAAQEGEWDELNLGIHRFQQANMAIKCSPKPVVVAPFNRTLGGGCEMALHAARVQASAELYMGLVEVGVGVIPGGGGCKELVLRWGDARRCFEQIGLAKVSSSAEDARAMGLLTPADRVSMNAERLVADAKALALSLAPGYVAPSPRQDIPVAGASGFALMKMGAWIGHQGGYLTDYDKAIAEKLAHVLSGGRLTGEQRVSEQYLLDLEREAFLSLCGDPRTQARMQHMLKTGKPLRN